MCNQFCDNCKILSFGHHFKEVEIKITYACPILRVSQKSLNILQSYIKPNTYLFHAPVKVTQSVICASQPNLDNSL